MRRSLLHWLFAAAALFAGQIALVRASWGDDPPGGFSGRRGRDLLRWSLPPNVNDPDALVPGGPVDCNTYNFQDFSFNQIDTVGRFPPKELAYQPRAGKSRAEFAPFSRKDDLVFGDNCVYTLDLIRASSSAPSLEAVCLKDFQDAFETAVQIREDQSNFDAIFSLTDKTLIEEYKKEREETRRVLAFEAEGLGQFSYEGERIAWAQKGVESNDYVVKAWDAFRLRGVKLSLPQAPGESHIQPAICGDWVAYVKYDAADATSSLWLYEISSEKAEAIGVGGTNGRNFLAPSFHVFGDVWPLDASRSYFAMAAEFNETRGDHIEYGCRLSWVETQQALAFDAANGDLTIAGGTGATDAAVKVLDFPQRTWHTPIEPAEWSFTAAGAEFGTGEVDGSGSFNYNSLVGMRVSGDYLNLLVAATNGAGAIVRTRMASMRVARRVYAPRAETDSSRALMLGQASSHHQLVWQLRPDQPGDLLTVFHVIIPVPANDEEQTSFCTVLPSAQSGHVAIFRDIVAWETPDEAGGDGMRVLLMDVNKDNDVLPDVTDWFPMNGQFWGDRDNDGIGDAADIVQSLGSCRDSDSRGKCWSDIQILYTVWGGYALIVFLVCFFGTRWYIGKKRIIRALVAGNVDLTSPNPTKPMYEDDPDGTADLFVSPATEKELEERRRRAEAGLPMTADVEAEAGKGAGDATSHTAATGMTHAVEADEADPAAPVVLPEGIQKDAITVGMFSLVGQMLVLALAIASLVMGMIPYLSTSAIALTTEARFIWADFFITYIFLADLVVRYCTRNPAHTPTLRAFLKKNWTDVLALFTDIPGVTGVGALGFLVLTRFRHIVRLFRMARILKVFRVVRAYRKVTRQSAVLDIMINRPTLFMGVFFGIILCLAAAVIKILEQNSSPDFGNFLTVLWFTIVTVTTVGYGDFVPVSHGARAITVILMSFGIGLVGMLTATVIKGVLLSGQSSSKATRRKRAKHNRLEMLRAHASRMSVAYNPMVMSYADHLQRSCASRLSMVDKIDPIQETGQHKSHMLNSLIDLEDELLMPVEELMMQATGKFRGMQGNMMQQTAEQEERQRRIKARRQALMHLISSGAAASVISPVAKLQFVLQFFKLDQGKEAVGKEGKDFNIFFDELREVLFGPLRPDDLFVAKALGLAMAMNDDGTLPSGTRPDLYDPLDKRLVRLEELLKRFHVSNRHDYHEILLELTLLTVMHDRVRNAQYAMRCLTFVKDMEGTERPKPAIRVSEQAGSQWSRGDLIPEFNFVSRRTDDASIVAMYRKEARDLAKTAAESRIARRSLAQPANGNGAHTMRRSDDERAGGTRKSLQDEDPLKSVPSGHKAVVWLKSLRPGRRSTMQRDSGREGHYDSAGEGSRLSRRVPRVVRDNSFQVDGDEHAAREPRMRQSVEQAAQDLAKIGVHIRPSLDGGGSRASNRGAASSAGGSTRPPVL
ncbi:unnamed protein product [Pedinophyceae sp. YPF-701]|nr:unnamed protein product [Pedinophyceae sp. YPF-701]